MNDKLNSNMILKQVDVLEREILKLKRNILHSLVIKERPKKPKTSLFGSVRGGDITDDMIEQSKRNLFRDLREI